MKIKAELLKIDSSLFDVRGQRIEPEARVAEKILVSDTQVTAHGQPHKVLGSMKTSINVQGTVGQFANELRSMCASCKHFDMNAWQKMRGQLSKKDLDNVKGALISQGLGPVPGAQATAKDEEELERAVNFMGVCKSISEQQKTRVVVHPMARCPPEYCTQSAPLGFFENTNLDTQRATDAAYDQVMRNAQGKRL